MRLCHNNAVYSPTRNSCFAAGCAIFWSQTKCLGIMRLFHERRLAAVLFSFCYFWLIALSFSNPLWHESIIILQLFPFVASNRRKLLDFFLHLILFLRVFGGLRPNGRIKTIVGKNHLALLRYYSLVVFFVCLFHLQICNFYCFGTFVPTMQVYEFILYFQINDSTYIHERTNFIILTAWKC